MSSNQDNLPQLSKGVWSYILRKLDNQTLVKAIYINPLWCMVCREDPVLRKNVHDAMIEYVKEQRLALQDYLMRNSPWYGLLPHEIDSLIIVQDRTPYGSFHMRIIRLAIELRKNQTDLDEFIKEQTKILNKDPGKSVIEYVEKCRAEIEKHELRGQRFINFFRMDTQSHVDANVIRKCPEKRHSIHTQTYEDDDDDDEDEEDSERRHSI